eukprot:Clim_evm80s108 gene=Clim_evmTU80s108
MAFFQRLVSHLVNDFLHKALVNSRTFQNLAFKTHQNVTKVQNHGKQVFDKVRTSEDAQKLHAQAQANLKDLGGQATSTVKQGGVFINAFMNNLKKGIQDANKK